MDSPSVSVFDYLQDFADTPENFRKIFVGGVSWATTEDRLQQYFEKMGAPVERLAIMRDKITGRSRGFGFVTFVSMEGLQLVCSRRHTLDGRQIECKRAIPKSEIASKVKKVFVGGIPLTLDEATLRQYFEKFGPVEECRIMTDGVSNRSRGFAFVCFYDDEVMNKVLSSPHSLDGKCFEVKKARVKPTTAQMPNMPATPENPFAVPPVRPVFVPYGNFMKGAFPSTGGFPTGGFPAGFFIYPTGPQGFGYEFGENGEIVEPQVSQQQAPFFVPPIQPIPASTSVQRPSHVVTQHKEVEQHYEPSKQETSQPTQPIQPTIQQPIQPIEPRNWHSQGPIRRGTRHEKQQINRSVSAQDTILVERHPLSTGTRSEKQNLNRTVSVNDKLLMTPNHSGSGLSRTSASGSKTLTSPRSSGSKHKQDLLSSQSPPPPSRLSKVAPAKPTVVSPRGLLVPVQEEPKTQAAQPVLERKSDLPVYQTRKEKEAQALKEAQAQKEKEQETETEEKEQPEANGRRKRGLSSPVLPLDPIRHLDLNWRSGSGKSQESTIHKYFALVPSTPEAQR